MSRILISVALLCFSAAFCSTAKAQHQPFIVFGLEIGGGFSSLSYDNAQDDWDEAGRAAFSGMAFALIPIFNPVYVQAGVRLHNIGNDVGFEVITEDDIVSGSNQITQNYLSVPVRLHVALGERGLYLMGGTEFGYLLSANIAQRIEPSFDTQRASITNNVNRLNMAVAGGLGYMIELTQGQIYLQAHFSRGISGVADNSGAFSWPSDWVTQEIMISLGLIF